MRSSSLTETVRRIALAASVASIALLAFAGPAALAAAPEAQKQSGQQPQWQQRPQQRTQQFQPRQQNNRVNQVQPQQQFQKQLQQQQQKRIQQSNQLQLQQQQRQIQQNNQVLRRQQKQIYQNNRAPMQAQQFPRFDWNTYRPGLRPPQWQQYRANFDPRPYECNRPAPRVYYVPVYQPPPGWSYRRWAYGQTYPRVYWTQPYWIGNYYNYGLPPPPYGYVWVRNGPDAMSVDVVTGLILQVVYGLFGSGGASVEPARRAPSGLAPVPPWKEARGAAGRSLRIQKT